MSDHKIVNGFCLQCLQNYCDAITEKQTKINSLVAEMNNIIPTPYGSHKDQRRNPKS